MADPTGRNGPEEDLDDLFENAPCGYVSIRPDGRIAKANRTLASWLGRDREQLVGRRFQDLLNIAGKVYYETHFAPLLRMQGFFHEVALDLVRQDGRALPVLVNADETRTRRVTERLRSSALRSAPVPFSLGWAAREPNETLAALLDRADQRLLSVRVEQRAEENREEKD